MELIRPIDAAAADSPRKAEGIGPGKEEKESICGGRDDQAYELETKKWAPERIVRANAAVPKVSTGWPGSQRRSLVRSECQPLKSCGEEHSHVRDDRQHGHGRRLDMSEARFQECGKPNRRRE